MDGIKTGYTRASGFNLVTSVKRGKRHLVAVVLGGRSGGARDARMRELIEANVSEGAINRTAPRIAEAPEAAAQPAPKARVASAEKAAPPVAAMREPAPQKQDTQKQDTPKQDSVTTAAIPPARQFTRCAGARIDRSDQAEPREDTHRQGERIADRVARAGVAAVADAGDLANACGAWRAQRAGIAAAASRREARRARRVVDASRRCARPRHAGCRARRRACPRAEAATRLCVRQRASCRDQRRGAHSGGASPGAPAALAISSESKPRSGWIVQVGAYEDIAEAREKLIAAKAKAANLLRSGDPFTEPVVKGDKTLYRARFAGLKQDQAEAVCRELKRTDIVCMAVKN